MSKKKKRLMLIGIVALVLVSAAAFFIFSILVPGKLVPGKELYATSHKTTAEENEELLALIKEVSDEASQADPPNQSAEIPEEAAKDPPDQESEAKETAQPLTDDRIKLCDIYSEAGSTAIFKCYDAAAESYEWEYYDLEENDWKGAEPSNIQSFRDELNREISALKVSAEKGTHELMVRCTLHFSTKEDDVQTASLFILKDKIKAISVEDITAAANSYIGTQELPVQVTYQDGSQEEITGLNDLYFLKSQEEKDLSTSISGNRVEITTLTTTECGYFNAILDEEQDATVRYRKGKSADGIEDTCTIIGKDTSEPVILDVTTSPYEVSNIDKPVTLTVTISAEDDLTPYPQLEYAFKFADYELKEEDWGRKPSFDVSIERNGTYIAYVKDQAGNISQEEKKIITVDNKAPVIASVSLSKADGWCQSNTIIVDAADAGQMKYSFENKAKGLASDWISYEEYAVDTNGTWTIRVQDDAGNISETEIEVSNIDREAPVIKKISVK